MSMSLLYAIGCEGGVSYILWSWRWGCIDVLQGLAPMKPASSIKYKAYILLPRDIPFVVLVTSKPRKYFNTPKSFIMNLASKRA